MLCWSYGTFFLLVFVNGAKTSNILCLFPNAPRSHINVFVPLIMELSSRGHHITVFTSEKLPNAESPNVTQFPVQGSEEALKRFSTNVFTQVLSHLSVLKSSVKVFTESCEGFLKDSNVQRMAKTKDKFDLVILDGVLNECAYPFGALLSDNLIALSPNGQQPWLSSRLPVPPSVVPMVYMGYKSRMDFFQKLYNSWIQLQDRLYYSWIYEPILNNLHTRHLPEAPHVGEIIQKVKLTLVNGDSIVYSPRPSIPEIVYVGGMQCRPAKPLPKDLSDFVDAFSSNGIIIFSLGSLARGRDMPIKTRTAFVNAFARLKQGVLWKFEEKIPELPPNVMTTSWLPLQDLLGHPKVVLFLTHGGLLSVQEALYHGVPVIGIPLFYDQPGNIARLQEVGVGESLQLSNINADEVYRKIIAVIVNPKYKQTMERYSAINRDQLQTPLERAVYWVEYMIRHKDTTHLLQPSDHLNICQYYLCDVILVATSVISILLALLFFGCRAIVKYFEKPTDESEKKRLLAQLKKSKAS